MWAMQGQLVCNKHGGGAPQNRAAAARRILDERAAKELARLDVPPVTNPLAELARTAGQAVAFKDAMAAKVNLLADVGYQSTMGLEQTKAELGLWERALDRC